MYTALYTAACPAMPDLLSHLANVAEMQRLADVGMHCGCEYTALPIYQNAKSAYTRLTHSMGVASIVWRFTQDLKQTVAGLLHDIATPAFAHTIDFMNNDHLTQESTEGDTRRIIEGADAIMSRLQQHGITLDEVCDYHIYPIADNDSPMLSADRLEYTLGNGHLVNHVPLQHIQDIYGDLFVADNEAAVPELAFRTLPLAKLFVEIALKNARFYVSNADRFAMQYLADIIRQAIDTDVLRPDDLYSTESHVIERLKSHHGISAAWEAYTAISSVSASKEKPKDGYSVKVDAKKRYIDPLVLTGGTVKRVSAVDAETNEAITSFLALDFDEWLHTT